MVVLFWAKDTTINYPKIRPFDGRLTAPGGVTANLTGNVTGNVTGDVTGNVTGNVTGVSTGANINPSEVMDGTDQRLPLASDGTSRQILFVSGSDTEYDGQTLRLTMMVQIT